MQADSNVSGSRMERARITSAGANANARGRADARRGIGQLLPALGLLLSALMLANSAAAGPNESPRQFSYNPEMPDLWVLKYQYSRGGLLVSTDGGASWGMMCGDSLDGMPRPKETYGMVVAADGSVFLGDFYGLLVGKESACEWSYVEPLMGYWVSDLQPDPMDPMRVFAVTSSGGKDNGLWAYDAMTQTWSQLGSPEQLTISSLTVTPKGDGLRFYESVVRSDPETFEPSFFIRYSDDEGSTWTEFDYPDQLANWLLVVAADPGNPDRVVVVEKNGPDGDPDRIMLSEMAGATGSFQVVHDDSHFGGAVFLPESGALYAGRTTGGVTVVSAPGAAPERRELFVKGKEDSILEPAPRTLTYHPERGLMAGVVEEFGTLDPDTGEFMPMLSFRSVERFHTCPGRDLAAECKEQLNFDAWCVHPGFDVAPFCTDAYPKPGRAPTATPSTSTDDDSGTVSAPEPSAAPISGNGLVMSSEDSPAEEAEGSGGAGTATSATDASTKSSSSSSCSLSSSRNNGAAGGLSWLAALGALFLWRRRRD